MKQSDIVPLLCTAISGIPLPIDVYAQYTDADWDCLMSAARSHGVLAVVFPAFEISKIHPSIDTLMDWFWKADCIKSKNVAKVAAIREFAQLIRKHNFEAMIMKGNSLSSYYPEPTSREFGDLDIYTFQNHDRFNALFACQNIDVKYGATHDEFYYAGLHIEHHRNFVSNYSFVSESVNTYLNEIVLENKGTLVGGLYFPCPDFNVVYLLRHMSKHLTGEGLILRQILDWGLFLDAEGENVGWDKTVAFLKSMKMTVAFDAMTAVAAKVTGLQLERYYIDTPNTKLVDKVLQEVLDTTIHAEEGHNVFVRFFLKLKRVLSHRWIYSSGLIPDKYWSEFMWWTARLHISKFSRI